MYSFSMQVQQSLENRAIYGFGDSEFQQDLHNQPEEEDYGIGKLSVRERSRAFVQTEPANGNFNTFPPLKIKLTVANRGFTDSWIFQFLIII